MSSFLLNTIRSCLKSNNNAKRMIQHEVECCQGLWIVVCERGLKIIDADRTWENWPDQKISYYSSE